MSDILHNEEPLVPKAMEVCKMPWGEEYVQCLWCPCRFANIHDFNQHVKAFGKNVEEHKRNWKSRRWQRELSEDEPELL
jgi:uncharacterized C2H2 Zn-finger protein